MHEKETKSLSSTLLEIYNKLLNHFGKQNWWPVIGPKKTRRIEIIIGAILTQNTAWKNVEKAIRNLYEKRMLSKKAILEAEDKDIQNLIRPCGYYRQKAKRLKEALKKINARVTRKDLLKIHGIGKETCDVILLYAYEKPYFVVDAYTKRIMERLGLIDNASKKSYNEIQKIFHENLPRDLEIYKEYHALLDELAKNYCKKKSPLCENCPILELCSIGKNKAKES